MIVCLKNEHTAVQFGDIGPGSLFMYEDGIFVKVSKDAAIFADCNAVVVQRLAREYAISEGFPTHFLDCIYVKPVVKLDVFI